MFQLVGQSVPHTPGQAQKDIHGKLGKDAAKAVPCNALTDFPGLETSLSCLDEWLQVLTWDTSPADPA
jgi:hypothetical protein